jgi:hypothetical protein
MRVVELLEELVLPARHSHAISDSLVLRRSTRVRDHGLTLGRPRVEVGSKKHCIMGSGPTDVWAPDPISIAVDDQLKCGAPKMEPVVNSTMEVPEGAA